MGSNHQLPNYKSITSKIKDTVILRLQLTKEKILYAILIKTIKLESQENQKWRRIENLNVVSK